MYEQVSWDSKLPDKLHAPVTTYEYGMADPVRVDKKAYGKKPSVSQVSDCGLITLFFSVFGGHFPSHFPGACVVLLLFFYFSVFFFNCFHNKSNNDMLLSKTTNANTF